MASDGGPSRPSSQVDQEYGDEQSKSRLSQCYSDSLSVTLISIYCWSNYGHLSIYIGNAEFFQDN